MLVDYFACCRRRLRQACRTAAAIALRSSTQPILQARRDAHPQAPDRRGEAGFTLVELLVVMVILVLLASVVGPRVLGYLDSSRAKTAKVQIEALASSLELYKLDVGSYPSTSDGLNALIEPPSGQKSWSGPYLKKRTLPADPWGTPYNYRHPGKFGEFDIYSFGADKKEGGIGENSDIVSW